MRPDGQSDYCGSVVKKKRDSRRSNVDDLTAHARQPRVDDSRAVVEETQQEDGRWALQGKARE